MGKKKPSELQVGDFICDMHDGLDLNSISGTLLSRRIVTIDCKSHDFIAQFTERPYTNKHLIVVEEPIYVENNSYQVKAAYSYDDRIFGLVVMVVKED